MPEPGKLKPRQDEQVPVARGTTAQALGFCAIMVLAALSPLALSLHWFSRYFEQSTAKDWLEQIDARTVARANTFDGPRIIFIGGSNIRFGIDAISLSQQVGMPVINYGLHAGLGIEIITDRAMQLARKGDIIIFAPELAHFRSGAEDPYLQLAFLDRHPSPSDWGVTKFPIKQWYLARWRSDRLHADFELFIRDEIAKCTRSSHHGAVPLDSSPTAYEASALGADGSIVFPRPRAIDGFDDLLRRNHPNVLSTLDLTNSPGARATSFVQAKCSALGCSFYIMPPFRLDIPSFDHDEAIRVEQKILASAEAKGATEFLAPGQTVLPAQYGFDGEYHLNDTGVKLLEPRVVMALKRAILHSEGKGN